MMTWRRVFYCVDAEPLRPFRITMASGECFEIRHLEMIQPGRTTATIFTWMNTFTWMNEENDDPREREQGISILLIESIEPLNPLTATNQS